MPMTADDRIRLIRVKIERANKHIDDLEDAASAFKGPVFKTVRLKPESEFRKPSLQFDPLLIYNSAVPAIAGDAVHNLMSALDHLAFQLVCVGVESGIERKERWESIQFPIAHDAQTYESRKGRYVDGAQRDAIEVLDRLKPYKGGNDGLWLLYKLDIADKHRVILAVGEDFIMDGIALKAHEPFFTELGTLSDQENVDLASGESFIQPAIGKSNALLPTLHQLSGLVSGIVESFRSLLGSPEVPAKSLSALEEFDLLEWPKFPWDE
jgi:hypothetical protein